MCVVPIIGRLKMRIPDTIKPDQNGLRTTEPKAFLKEENKWDFDTKFIEVWY